MKYDGEGSRVNLPQSPRILNSKLPHQPLIVITPLLTPLKTLLDIRAPYCYHHPDASPCLQYAM